ASLRYFVFPTLSDLSGFPVRSDFLGAFPGFAFAFPFPAVPTLSEVFGRSDRLGFRKSGRLLDQ
ncbi:hypothetical protein, partial [Streptomyces longispororuber]|uniref:hypothetical protein n=1 Tax=Streptomyces longispororuber TaxID=68230 RepID=UPI001E537E1A